MATITEAPWSPQPGYSGSGGGITVTGTPITGDSPVATSGTTATWQTYAQPFSVKVYGAAGDGSTDDTTAINAAIAAATASPGGYVFFPPGVYITQPLTLPPGTVLRGVNAEGYYNATTTIPNEYTQSQLKLKSGSTGALISPYDGGANLSTGVSIFDLALNCNALAYPAINFPNTTSVTRLWAIERCYLFNVGSTANGVYVGTGQAGVRFSNCQVFNGTSGAAAGGAGFLWEGIDGIIENCWVGFWGTYGLQTAGSTDICLNVRGGGFFANSFAGIGLGCPGVVVDGASVDGNNGYGVFVSETGCILSGVRFTGNTSANVYMYANDLQIDLVGCRYHGTGTPYMIEIASYTGCTINDIGTIVETGATWGTAYTDNAAAISTSVFTLNPAVGTTEETVLTSLVAMTIDSATHTLVTSPSLAVGTWLVIASLTLEYSTSISTYIDFALALGTAVGTIVGAPAFSLSEPSASFEYGVAVGTSTCVVTVTTAGTVLLNYNSTSTGGGANALVQGANTNLGRPTGILAVRIA